MNRVPSRLTYANVMVTLLALVVLGAVAYAIFELLPNDSDDSSNVGIGGGGVTPGLQPAGPWHLVGAANEPPFATSRRQPACTWGNLAGRRSAASFYRDSNGVVHLRGHVVAQGTCDPARPRPPIFTLPPGYRPGDKELLPSGPPGYPGFPVTITGNGLVGPRTYYPLRRQPIPISLDGMSFRCGPSGQNGCP